MGLRSLPACSVALVCAIALGCTSIAPLGALDAPTPGGWLRPVPGALARPFVEPRSRYGAGHRGVDFVAAAGTAVRAANAGEVSFAGSVAGALHVVLMHTGGLRTSSSFLATIAVRRGQHVERGDVIGTTSGGTGEHAGVLHFGLRVGDRYVDPMTLFVPADLTRLIRLIPVDAVAQAGLDPPALERRSLAESLHLPRGVADLVAPPAPESGPLASIGDALGDLAAVARVLVAPAGTPMEALGVTASWLWRASIAAPIVSDAVAVSERLLAWARSRRGCDADPSQPAGGGGSGHLALTIAGINSRTDPATGTALPIDTDRLGYRAGEVHSFSYAADGGPYDASDTTDGLERAVTALGVQLRTLQRVHPGREVDLIAHSQGGVVVAKFLAHGYEAGDPTLPPLGTVVTLASPLQGAPVATAVERLRASRSGRAATDAIDRRAAGAMPPLGGASTRQLSETSRFIRALNRAALPEQIDVTAIGATDDFIVPANHADRPGVRSVTVDPAGFSDHSSLLRDGAALDAVRHALEGRSPPCVGIVAGGRAAVAPVVISRAERTAGQVGGAAGAAFDSLVDIGGSR
jgi:triacylglycerol esterase/lipase EstA (alpha/beta hydrolase family)